MLLRATYEGGAERLQSVGQLETREREIVEIQAKKKLVTPSIKLSY